MKAHSKCNFYRDWWGWFQWLKLDCLEELDYSLFEKTFIDVLSTNAPIKTKNINKQIATNLWLKLFGKP